MIDLADLDSRYTRLADEHSSRQAAAHAAVVRWQWYDDDAFDMRPLWYERNRWRPGRSLDQRPPLTRDHHRVGFDAEGRVVANLEYSGFLDGRLYYETFRAYHADLVEEAHYYADGRPIYLHEHHLEAGLIRASASSAIHGAGIERYEYVDDRVVRITAQHAKRESGALGELRPYADYEAEYDRDGLHRLTSTAGRHSETLYERPPADFVIESACRAVEAELLVQVPRAVRELGIEQAAYCVALVYDDVRDPSQVTIHVGLQEDRQAILAEQDDDSIVWSPADMAGEATVDMAAVQDTARLLAQELTASNVAMSREVLCAVAARLADLDWQTIMPITDDFTVFAVDLEMADLERNLTAARGAAEER